MTTPRRPSVRIEQAPGWWASLVNVHCEDCGWTLRVDLNNAPNRHAEREAERHVCDE